MTHLGGDSYRRFDGVAAARRLLCLPLAWDGIRVAARSRITLLVLYLMPAGWSIVFCFNVYLKYAAETGAEISLPGGLRHGIARMVGRQIEVSDQLDVYFNISRLFVVLAMGWYGAGLLADDRRRGAHLLLFARPLGRATYLLGRFLTLAFYGALAMIAPGLLICATAAFNSPEWSFVREDGGLIAGTLAYGAVVVTSLGLVVLALSSLVSRKTYALLGLFAVLLLPDAVARLLHGVMRDDDFRALSLLTTWRRIGWSLLDRQPYFRFPVEWSWAYVAGLAAACLGVLAWRVRRWEVAS